MFLYGKGGISQSIIMSNEKDDDESCSPSLFSFIKLPKMKKKTEQEITQDICKKFLKSVIVDETTVDTKKFRNDLYKKLVKFGIWNNYDFCFKLDEDEFMAFAGYKTNEEVKKLFNIQDEIKAKHFKQIISQRQAE